VVSGLNRRALPQLLLAALPLAISSLAAQEQPGGMRLVNTSADGSGATREEAVTNALVTAQEQVNGVAVANRPILLQQFSAVVSDRTDTIAITTQLQQEMMRLSGGFIRSYRVLDVKQTDGGGFIARVEAEVATFRTTQDTAETRRRIGVSAFVDQNGRRTEFGTQLRERLVQYLTQSRRFSVLDRSNDGAYDREMALLVNDAPLAERVRVGQVLGADYIVVGRMRNVGQVNTETYISLTGEVVRNSFARGNLDFQVLEVATRQVRWASTIRMGTQSNLNQILDGMATRLGREVTQTIYPMRLIRMDDPNELIINQGGVTVDEGQRFRAMILGEELTDPYTRESLGRVEREVGQVQVMRVDQRVSYARWLGPGPLPMGSDVVLRLVAEAPPPPQPRRPQGYTGTPPALRLPSD